jgi:hypothetical protein
MTGLQAERQTEGQTKKNICLDIDRQTNGQTDRQPEE